MNSIDLNQSHVKTNKERPTHRAGDGALSRHCSAGPPHPMGSVPSSMIASSACGSPRFASAWPRFAARGVELGGAQEVDLMWAWNGILFG